MFEMDKTEAQQLAEKPTTIAQRVSDFLAEHKGQIVSMEQIIDGVNYFGDPHLVRQKVYAMIKKDQVIRVKNGYFKIKSDYEDINLSVVSHTGSIAQKVSDWLAEHKGQKFRMEEMITDIEHDGDPHVARQKVYAMVKKDQVSKIGRGYFKVNADYKDVNMSGKRPNKKKKKSPARSFKDHPDNFKNQHAEMEKQTLAELLTPKAQQNLERLNQARDAQPLDIGQTFQALLDIDEQNKIYRNALEQIGHILEQAGIFQRVD